jgi:hypothetical protein
MSKPPRNVNSHPRKNIRLVTLLNGSMRIVPALPKRVQGISRREWLRIKVELPLTYLTHPITQRV